MRARRVLRRIALVVAPLVILAFGGACSGADATSKAASPAGSSGQPASAAVVSGAVTLIATDNKFDKTAMTMKANEEITLTLENKGAALHDFKVLGVKDKSGVDIATKLLQKDQTETIRFTIDKTGTFDYYCEVHPAEMRGKLTVQ